MPESFSLILTPHAAFGTLAALVLPNQPVRRFTREEAAIVARALNAVAAGASSERQIYMSPIASDHDFEARVGADGIFVADGNGGEAPLDWAQTRLLAGVLARFGAAS